MGILSGVCPAARNTEPSRADIYRVVEGQPYSVIDISELVKGDREPRGWNRVAILSHSLQPIRVFEYLDRRPLFCKGNQLYLYGDLSVDQAGPEGNVLTFTNGAHDIAVSHTEANDVPALIIRDAQHPPQ